jgi:pyrroline-5-carboxylate reductase
MFEDQVIAFIGGGVMGEAMIRGLLSQEIVTSQQVIVADPWDERRQFLSETYGIRATPDNREAGEIGHIIVLSIKPQSVPYVLPEIRGHLRSRDLLLSIIAGTPIRTLSDGAAHASVVRAMPNTPAQIGMGITVWTATNEVSDAHKAQARAVLGSLGEEIFMEHESYLDMATALSGSGPGYVFMMVEALIDAGVHLGFSRHVARRLVFETIRGSVAYAEQSGKHVAELRNQVTSPGGTTAAALYHMEKGGLRTVISRGIWAAYQRSVELGQGQDVKGPG